MGRARYPAMWRLLDRAAADLGHVVWSDVTNRGFTVVEITPSEVRSDHWFVRPYVDDPDDEAQHAAGFTAAADAWPPTLRATPGPPPAEPVGADVPGGLPPRPADLSRIRRRRRARIAAKAAATATACAGLVVGLWRLAGSARRPG